MNQTVVKAVVASSATTLVFVAIVFLLIKVLSEQRKKKEIDTNLCREEAKLDYKDVNMRFDEKVKGVIVDENGRSVLYTRRHEELGLSTFRVILNPSYENYKDEKTVDVKEKEPAWQSSIVGPPEKTTQQLSLPEKKVPATTPPPPASPPPPQKEGGGLLSLLRPPPVPRASNKSKVGTRTESINRAGQFNLRPLHWDKIIATADQSMVWNHIDDGSLRFDDDLIKTLFGYTCNTRLSGINVSQGSSHSNHPSRVQVFILEPRKSQNTAIIVRSLAASRKEILEAILEGHGLSIDTLEKLSKIAPTHEEETKILQFNGKLSQLADAESFLYHILKAIPSAFIRVNAMLFRSSYDQEILHVKESTEVLKMGCNELRSPGLFLKLLEAILKTGNKMNAGTSRGNAKGFNLNALKKLSDVKSSDGKTTLLHFVVEQVVRSEGKQCQCVINQNHSFSRLSNISSTNQTEEEKEKHYLMKGLLVLEGLSTELSNVKNAAMLEYNTFINACSSLTTRVAEIRKLLVPCEKNQNKNGFVVEMEVYLEECLKEVNMVKEEQIIVMELVRRTTKYYQGGFKDISYGSCPLQLFVFVNDFLCTVDRICADIARKVQTNAGTTSVGASPLFITETKAPMKFLDRHSVFVSDNMYRTTYSTESEDDFM